MATVEIRMFRRLSICHNGQPVAGLEAGKLQELLCYLLIHRAQPQPREVLASMLWGDYSTAQSKKHLRQALWQLQAGLDLSAADPCNGHLLLVDADWVQINPHIDLWLDVAAFEQACALSAGRPGRLLDDETACRLRDAVQLYQGDLLEGWYQDWCLFERERLQNLFLALLDRLVDYCEASQRYELGRAYASRSLRYDPARERTHRQLMRLAYLAGDRTAALRQYEQCAAALLQHLGVMPAARTVRLYEQICADHFSPAALDARVDGLKGAAHHPAMAELLGELQRLRAELAAMEHRVQASMRLVEQALGDKSDSAAPPRSTMIDSLRVIGNTRHLIDGAVDAE